MSVRSVSDVPIPSLKPLGELNYAIVGFTLIHSCVVAALMGHRNAAGTFDPYLSPDSDTPERRFVRQILFDRPVAEIDGIEELKRPAVELLGASLFPDP